MRALLRPRHGRPGDSTETVEMIARTGNGRVTVRFAGRTPFAVDTFRLYSEADRTRRIAATELAALPWNGKGPDPIQGAYQAAMKSADTPAAPPAHRDTAASPTSNLTLRSPAERGVSKGRHEHAASPSFETAVSRPPQDEDGTAIARRA